MSLPNRMTQWRRSMTRRDAPLALHTLRRRTSKPHALSRVPFKMHRHHRHGGGALPKSAPQPSDISHTPILAEQHQLRGGPRKTYLTSQAALKLVLNCHDNRQDNWNNQIERRFLADKEPQAPRQAATSRLIRSLPEQKWFCQGNTNFKEFMSF